MLLLRCDEAFGGDEVVILSQSFWSAIIHDGGLAGGGGLIGVFVSVVVGRALLIEGGLMKGLGVEIVIVPGEGVAYGDEDIEDGR